jgi:hypothetical protein
MTLGALPSRCVVGVSVEILLSIVVAGLTLGSLVYAMKTKGEEIVNISLHAMKLQPNDDVSAIIDSAQLGARDATAATRMPGNLLNEVQSLQMGMFGTADTVHPDLAGSDGGGGADVTSSLGDREEAPQ